MHSWAQEVEGFDRDGVARGPKGECNVGSASFPRRLFISDWNLMFKTDIVCHLPRVVPLDSR